MKNDIAIFVGAYIGDDLISYAEDNTDVYVIGFEPNIRALDVLIPRTAHLDNVLIVPQAVSYVDGPVKFYITNLSDGDMGCSSLLEYSDNIDNLNTHGDMKHSDTLNIMCTRIDTFLDKLNFEINSIKTLVLDVQGWDYECLLSTGKYVNIIEHGYVEVVTYENALYKGQNNIIGNVARWLYEHNFIIYDITNNDHYNPGTEMNVLFKKI